MRDTTITPVNRGGARGIAMLLVLVALVVTTILVGAALTSRENSPAIGANAASSARATWSAESAANFAVGAVNQATDIATLLGGDDTLTQTMTMNGATLDIRVTNLTGDPPTDADRELIVRAKAAAGGVEKVVEKRLIRYPGGDAADGVDPYLPEFAVFATEKADIQSGSKTTIWDLSPEASASTALAKLGFGFANDSDLTLDPDAELERVGLYADASASLALETTLQSANVATTWIIPYDIPTHPSALPTAFSSLAVIGTDVVPAASATETPAAAGIYGKLDARNTSTVVLDAGSGTTWQFQSINVQDSSLVIRGNHSIYVEGNFDIDAGFLVLQDNTSSATFYIGGDVKFTNNGKAGITPADTSTGVGVVSVYVDPERLRLLALSPLHGGTNDPHWDFHNQSATIAFMHNPLGRVHLQGSGIVYGHAVAREFWNHSGSAFYYCPTLDNRLGFTSPYGPLYDAVGDPAPKLETLVDSTASTTNTAQAFSDKFDFEYNLLVNTEPIGYADLTSSKTRTIIETTSISVQ